MFIELELMSGRHVVVELSDYLFAAPGDDPSDEASIKVPRPDDEAWAILTRNF